MHALIRVQAWSLPFTSVNIGEVHWWRKPFKDWTGEGAEKPSKGVWGSAATGSGARTCIFETLYQFVVMYM